MNKDKRKKEEEEEEELLRQLGCSNTIKYILYILKTEFELYKTVSNDEAANYDRDLNMSVYL